MPKKKRVFRAWGMTFPWLHVPGLDKYEDRSVAMNGKHDERQVDGTVIVTAGDNDFQNYLDWVLGMPVGADSIIQVNGSNVIEGIKADPWLSGVMHDELASGSSKAEFFHGSEAEEDLLSAMELDWSHTSTCPPGAAMLDDKGMLRKQAKLFDLDKLFCYFRFAGSFEETVIAVREVENSVPTPDFVLVRATNRESGEWNFRYHGEAGLEALAEFCRGWFEDEAEVELLVEAGFRDIVDLSINAEVINGRVADPYLTTQFAPNGVHAGNTESTRNEQIPPQIRQMMIAAFKQVYWLLIASDPSIPLQGSLGADFIFLVRHGVLKITELNLRVGGSRALHGLVSQVKQLGGPCAGVMQNVSPSRVNNFAELCDALGDLMFDERTLTGVFPLFPRCLGLGEPKFAAVCLDRDVVRAQAMLRAVERIVGHRGS